MLSTKLDYGKCVQEVFKKCRSKFRLLFWSENLLTQINKLDDAASFGYKIGGIHMNYIIPAGMQRVFIGIQVNEHAQARVNKLINPVRDSSREIRWVPENNRHLTLAFLGDRPIGEVENLARQFDETYQRVTRFQYDLSALVRFPDPGGRIIALIGEPTKALEVICF